MTNSLYPWQESSWLQLQQLKARLPHAILFYGQAGIGKTVFVERFAQSLLCQHPLADGQPCGKCASCGWFSQYAHLDYRRVRPELLDGEESQESEEGSEVGDSKKSVKTPSKDIKIDQIRSLADFMNISTHRQGMRVIVLYPAEALNTASANALLKTLEEPPPNTIFLLVSNNIDRILPTILSRCRKFALPMPSREQALQWLQQQQIEDADVWLAQQGGAPLAAQAQAALGNREIMSEFLGHLAHPNMDGMLKIAEKMQKMSVIELLAWLQRWQYDIYSHKLSGIIRYYPEYQKELAALAGQVGMGALLMAQKAIIERRKIASHPLSPKLFIEDMLLDYATLFS